jgi:orotidine-5'-phosphate decarboxylase
MNAQGLFNRIMERNSFLCVGLDPDPLKMPLKFKADPDRLFNFCASIIDATRDLCVSYKPNTAFFECHGTAGWDALRRVIEYIGKEHFVIADAKRGDIGNTAAMYADAFFQSLQADAVTVAPYMGRDSVDPFLSFQDKWAVVLALTSNKGSEDFQLLSVEDAGSARPLFETVLRKVASWGTTDNLMFVVGATHPDLFRAVRKIVPDHFLLVPGVGAQGGDLEAVCAAGMNERCGLLVNSSRQILYASGGDDFVQKARMEAVKLRDQMAALLERHIN